MTGCTWASWQCCHWFYTGSSLSGTLERKGNASHSGQITADETNYVFGHRNPWPIGCILWHLLRLTLMLLILCIFFCSSSALFQHITALFECSAAAVLTLLVNDPVGLLSIRSCRVQMLSDWYTMLYNPSLDYITTLHCTQEAVFPLWVAYGSSMSWMGSMHF